MSARSWLALAHGLVQVVGQRLVFQQLADGALALVETGGHLVQLGHGVVDVVVQGVVGDQLADRAFAVGDRIHQLRQLIQGRHGFVVEVGIVDQLADRALGGVERVGEVVDLGQDGIQLLDRSLAGLDDVGEVGGLVGFELRVVLDRRAGGGLAVDVHDGIAQDADGLQAGGGIGMHGVSDIWLRS